MLAVPAANVSLHLCGYEHAAVIRTLNSRRPNYTAPREDIAYWILSKLSLGLLITCQEI